jgi:hypothetical protein
MKQLTELLAEKNGLITKGQILEAAEKFFSMDVKTVDFTGAKANGKKELMEGLKSFVGSIKKVNEITLHRSGTGDDVSFAEFTFDFDMQDGSKIHWHEIIRSVWRDGQIALEEYFQGL